MFLIVVFSLCVVNTTPYLDVHVGVMFFIVVFSLCVVNTIPYLDVHVGVMFFIVVFSLCVVNTIPYLDVHVGVVVGGWSILVIVTSINNLFNSTLHMFSTFLKIFFLFYLCFC